jgi:hypothetical protein
MGVAPSLALDDARLAIASIGLVPAGGCPSGAAEEALAAPVVGDLVAPSAEPFDLDVAPGDYCEARIALAPSAEARGLALLLDGTRSTDRARVLVEDAEPLELTLVASGGASFALGEGEQVLVAIDRTLLEAPLGVPTLALDTDGVAHVDATRNTDRLLALRGGLAGAVTLRRDANADGALDADEAAAPPLAAMAPP